jgi:hypothetical protein
MPPKPLFSVGALGCTGVAVPAGSIKPRPAGDPRTSGWSSVSGQCCWTLLDNYQCDWQDIGNIPSGVFTDLDCKKWSGSRQVCDNFWLGPGAVPRPWDHPYFYTPNGGTTDTGCTDGGVNFSNTGLVADNRHIAITGYTLNNDIDQACGDVAGSRDIHYKSGTGANFTWDGATIDAYNAAHGTSYGKTSINGVRLYYMNVVLGIPGSTLPSPVSSAYPWWIFGKAVFAASTGSPFPISPLWNCVRTADAYNGFGGSIISAFNEYLGCPYIFTEQNRGGGIGGFNSYDQFSGYNLTGAAPTKSTVSKMACYLPLVGPVCPPVTTVDGSGHCIGNCVAPVCPTGYTSFATYPAYQAGGPYCIREFDQWTYPQYKSMVRAELGRKLYSVTALLAPASVSDVVASTPIDVVAGSDAVGEAVSYFSRFGGLVHEASVNCSLHADSADTIHIFYIKSRLASGGFGTVDSYEVRYMQSRDYGKTMYPQTTGGYAAASMAQVTSGALTYNVVSPLLCSGYQKIRPIIDKQRRLILFGYKLAVQQWFVRVGKFNVAAQTWDMGAENFVYQTGDYSWDELQELPGGEYEFRCFSDAGQLMRLVCKSLDPSGIGAWAPEIVVAPATGEYYDFGMWHEKEDGGISALLWKPNQLGRTRHDPPTFQYTGLGSWVARNFYPDGSGGWTPGPETVVRTNVAQASLGPLLRQAKTGRMEMFSSGSFYFICRNFSASGTGTWTST